MQIIGEGRVPIDDRRFGGKFPKVKMFNVEVHDSRRSSWFVDSRIAGPTAALPRPPEGFTNVIFQRKPPEDNEHVHKSVENMPLRLDQLIRNAQHIKRLANVKKAEEETKLVSFPS